MPITAEQIQHELALTAATLPIAHRMGRLFSDPDMFRSYGRFSSAGFSLVDHSPEKMLVGTHKRAPGYVFKKFSDAMRGDKQVQNYMRRIEGARLIAQFIAERGFSRVTVPRKWLYELPETFPERYLVVAERMDILSKFDTLRRYARIRREQTLELAAMLYHFRGLNSTASNLPYTEDGRIAFIDTERWHRDKDLLHNVGDWLPAKRRADARRVFKELERQGAAPFTSSFK